VSASTLSSLSHPSSPNPPAHWYLPPPSSASSWDEIEPHFIYSQLNAGRRQLSQGEFLALFSTPEGNSPELGTTVTYGVSTDVPGAGEGVRDGGGTTPKLNHYPSEAPALRPRVASCDAPALRPYELRRVPTTLRRFPTMLRCFSTMLRRTEGLDRFRGLPSYTRFGQSNRTQKRHGTST